MLFVFCCYGFYFCQKIDPEVKLWLLIKADLILVGALERKNVTSMRETKKVTSFVCFPNIPVSSNI